MSARSTGILLIIALALVAVLIVRTRSQVVEEPSGDLTIWSVPPDELVGVTIDLPRHERSESWVRNGEGRWSFDLPQRPAVDAGRWSGVPILLSGPRAERLIASQTPAARLSSFGLLEPAMRIVLRLDDGERMSVDVGDATPDGTAVYVRAPGSTSVFTVARSWYVVLERLVLDPPHPAEQQR